MMQSYPNSIKKNSLTLLQTLKNVKKDKIIDVPAQSNYAMLEFFLKGGLMTLRDTKY